MKKTLKKYILLLTISFTLVSCKNSVSNYDTTRITSNFHKANMSTFADGTAKNIIVYKVRNYIFKVEG